MEAELKRITDAFLSGGKVNYRSDGSAEWEINSGQFRTVAELNERKCLLIINLACLMPFPLLTYSENPLEDGLGGKWEYCDAAAAWKVPRDFNVEQFFGWLFLGNWRLLFFHGNPPYPMLSINAFHDNDPWFVLLLRAQQCHPPD